MEDASDGWGNDFMADISSKQDEMGVLQKGEERKTAGSDGSVLLDIERLSLLASTRTNAPDATTEAAAAAASNNPAPAPLHTTQARKFFQRGDRMAAPDDSTPFNSAAAAAADGGRGANAATVALAPVAPATDKFVAVVLSPTATSEAKAHAASPLRGPPPRRIHVRRSAATSPWLDPRRVLLSFAALSSLGTIILLYFTLSMDKMGGGDGDGRR